MAFSTTEASIFPARASSLSTRHDQMRRIHLEVLPQGGAGIGATEAVGAERGVGAVDEPGHLVGHGAHVVGDGDHGVGPRAERRGHERPALLFGRVEAIPALGLDGVVAQLAPRGHRPGVGRNPPT